MMGLEVEHIVVSVKALVIIEIAFTIIKVNLIFINFVILNTSDAEFKD
jgi:hypothetical protein